MRTCQEFVAPTKRCGKPAVVSELPGGITRDLCAECAKRLYMKAPRKQRPSITYDRPEETP